MNYFIILETFLICPSLSFWLNYDFHQNDLLCPLLLLFFFCSKFYWFPSLSWERKKTDPEEFFFFGNKNMLPLLILHWEYLEWLKKDLKSLSDWNNTLANFIVLSELRHLSDWSYPAIFIMPSDFRCLSDWNPLVNFYQISSRQQCTHVCLNLQHWFQFYYFIFS